MIPTVSNHYRVANLFHRLIDLTNNCRLFIPDTLFEGINFMEENLLVNNRHYIQMIEDNNAEVADVILDYFNGKATIDNFYHNENPIELVQKVISKSLLNTKELILSNNIKNLIIEIFFENICDDDLFYSEVVDVYYKIPKYQRILISFVINHMKK